MLKPRRLYPGDRVAMVSLSWGGLGDPQFLHKYDIAKKRLKEEFQLELVPMPHALKGSDFVARHPELRAQDLMDAFRDRSIAAIFCAIGGDDTIRTLPYIDFAVMRDNPKIFMGYSDTTINHLMMQRAGLVSFYGPSVMCEFGEYVRMFDYTREAVRRLLFADSAGYVVPSSPSWSDDYVPWDEQNVHIAKRLRPEAHGYELLQGSGKVQGQLMGGCVDVFCMAVGTPHLAGAKGVAGRPAPAGDQRGKALPGDFDLCPAQPGRAGDSAGNQRHRDGQAAGRGLL